MSDSHAVADLLRREIEEAWEALDWADEGSEMSLVERAEAATTAYFGAEQSRKVMARALGKARDERDEARAALAALRGRGGAE